MLAEALMKIIFFFLKIAIWIAIALAVIPFGIFVLLANIIPEVAYEGGFWFWALFVPLNLVAYYFLWKPIVFVIGAITALCEGTE